MMNEGQKLAVYSPTEKSIELMDITLDEFNAINEPLPKGEFLAVIDWEADTDELSCSIEIDTGLSIPMLLEWDIKEAIQKQLIEEAMR